MTLPGREKELGPKRPMAGNRARVVDFGCDPKKSGKAFNRF